MRKVLIVSGGNIDTDFGQKWIAESKPDYLMAVDSGMEFFRQVQLVPQKIVGDFDSVRKETLNFFQEQEGIQWKILVPEKDDTDTECAIRDAIANGATQIELLGATGSRLDHVLGNIELLGIGLQEKVEISIVDEHNRIRMCDADITFKRKEQYGKYVSLIPYTEKVSQLTLTGFKYPLKDATLQGFCSLGISNEIIEDEAFIQFKEGILLVVEAKD